MIQPDLAAPLSLSRLSMALNLPGPWLRAEARAGRLPCLKAGKRLLFDRKAVEQALASRARSASWSLPDVTPVPVTPGKSVESGEQIDLIDFLIPAPWIVEQHLAARGVDDPNRDLLQTLLLLSREKERRRHLSEAPT